MALLPVLASSPESKLRFEITFDAGLEMEPVDGRVILILAPNDESEPRFQARWGVRGVPVFGVNIDRLAAGEAAVIDGTNFGYPFARLGDLPAGRYYVQAVLHKYETFNLSTGHTVKLPMDRGEGQRWSRAPGNLLSEPRWIDIDPAVGGTIRITLDDAIPPIEPPDDTEYIKHVRIQSDLLTEFWGRPMHLGAHVLLPEGFEEHPEARYPLVIFHGHFPYDFGGFRTEPPDPDLEPITASASTSTGTTGSCSRKRTTSTRHGRDPTFREC